MESVVQTKEMVLGFLVVYLLISIFSLILTIVFYYGQGKKPIYGYLVKFWLYTFLSFLIFGATRGIAETFNLEYVLCIAIAPARAVSSVFADLLYFIYKLPRVRHQEFLHFTGMIILSSIAFFVIGLSPLWVAMIASTYTILPIIGAVKRLYSEISERTIIDKVIFGLAIVWGIHSWDYSVTFNQEAFIIPSLALACSLCTCLAVILPYRILEFSDEGYKRDLEEKIEQNTRELSELYSTLAQKSKVESIAVLASGVAHEINNPLAIISSSNKVVKKLVAREDLKSKSTILRLQDQIEEAVKRASNISWLLSKISSSKASTENNTKINLNELIQSILSEYQEEIDTSNIKIDLEQQSELYILGDTELVKEMLNNLIKNSIEALDKVSNPRIDIKLYENSSKVFVDIMNNGKEITEEISQKIFAPFFTTKDIGKHTGLGLTTSQVLAIQLSGKLSLEDLKLPMFRLELPTFTEG